MMTLSLYASSPLSPESDSISRPLERRDADAVLISTLEQLDWVDKVLCDAPTSLLDMHPVTRLDTLPSSAVIGCPGVPGGYTHIASERLFPQGDIRFYEEFSDVAQAVRDGEVRFGVLPVENSSAGQVSEVLDLVSRHHFYINHTASARVEHCLCIHPDTRPEEITSALSHPQALAQCRKYLENRGLVPERFSNTAAAAKHVAENPGSAACICSQRGAQIYGLRVLETNIEDFAENYTRFLCISCDNLLLTGADTISITLRLPHEPGALVKLLTRFAACSLDLSKLLSMPIASRDFSAQFYLDFSGSIEDNRVVSLLSAMCHEFSFFKFLGNYPGARQPSTPLSADS